MKNQKGFINIELIITLILILIFLTTIINLNYQQYEIIDETQNRKQARLLVDDITQIISTQNTRPEGYITTYTMPDKINNETYILIINETHISINSHYQIASSKLQKTNIKPKKHILTPGNTYQFKTKNKTIYILDE
ncbi:hypothetical protein [uncultured Methanosphaera sp.]|uniref:hypothetical protein n=1 Tax=uncultured Methanosphaera sp. TaxID=262501 RepID=UPI002803B5F6|nr:hypothetical protein [uncultured Methanosphaera sp.]